MEILISVSYMLEVEQDEFWDQATGRLHTEVGCCLHQQFPLYLAMPNGVLAKRSKLSYIPLGRMTSEKCPLCQKWMTRKPQAYSALLLAKEIAGDFYCEHCAYEVQNDLKQGR